MPLLVIRHARAGDRDDWRGDDRERPLDKRGRRQADALVEELEGYPISRILSSPYDRCVQTVEPSRRGAGSRSSSETSSARAGSTTAPILVRSLVGQPVAVCVHGGLSDTAFGERLKKGETLVVDERGDVVDRLRV
jgi:8-oxo-dGTP diphosphatase